MLNVKPNLLVFVEEKSVDAGCLICWIYKNNFICTIIVMLALEGIHIYLLIDFKLIYDILDLVF